MSDVETAEFTQAQHDSLMKTVEDWFDTIDAAGLSVEGMAALLRDVADRWA